MRRFLRNPVPMPIVVKWIVVVGAAFVVVAASQVYAGQKRNTIGAQLHTANELALVARVQLAEHGGIGFDDLLYSPALDQLLVPAANTGLFALIEPASRRIRTFEGLGRATLPYRGGHDVGMTSADTDGLFAYANDRTSRSLLTIDVERATVASRIELSAAPDYVRYVASTHEIWVTEPDSEQIEIFGTPHAHLAGSTPTRITTLKVPGGPESLVVDQPRNRAYAHLWRGQTVVIDVTSRRVVLTYANGCRSSRGIALDSEQRLVFAGCSEGRVTVLDEKQAGKIVGHASTSSGVDLIAYNQELRHLYVPGASDGQMSVFSVAPNGRLRDLGKTRTAEGAHCVTADNREQVWVCDPRHGSLLVFKDQ